MQKHLIDRWNTATTKKEHEAVLRAAKRTHDRDTIAWIVVVALVGLILCYAGCKQSPDDYTYPRRAVQAAQLLKWMDRADDPLCFAGYDMIVTSSPPSEVDAVLNRARQVGAGKWADRVTICYKCCLRTVKAFNNALILPTGHLAYGRTAPPPDWLYAAARWSPHHAHEIAVYENAIRGCDWLIRDQHGNPIEIYTGDHLLTDWSPYCPRGLWDGVIRVGGETHFIGDTRGLTVYEWLAGPMRANVVQSERFLDTYDVLCLDDDPFLGAAGWHVPPTTLFHLRGPTVHSMVNIQHYNQVCRPAAKAWQYEFAGKLNRRIIMLAQNCGFDPGLDSVFTTDVHINYNGSILPSYGYGGYWPRGDILAGWEQWSQLDKVFTPYGIGMHWKIDAMQGGDVCFTECCVGRYWSQGLQRQRARESLGHTLVGGDAYFHVAYQDDEAGIKYGKGLKDLFSFPEMELDLGKALTECLEFNDPAYVGKPLFCRYFRNGKHQYTVVINMHEVVVRGIPARDAVWFHGLWPRLHSGEVVF